MGYILRACYSTVLVDIILLPIQINILNGCMIYLILSNIWIHTSMLLQTIWAPTMWSRIGWKTEQSFSRHTTILIKLNLSRQCSNIWLYYVVGFIYKRILSPFLKDGCTCCIRLSLRGRYLIGLTFWPNSLDSMKTWRRILPRVSKESPILLAIYWMVYVPRIIFLVRDGIGHLENLLYISITKY